MLKSVMYIGANKQNGHALQCCHPERSEGSPFVHREILRAKKRSQDDSIIEHFVNSQSPVYEMLLQYFPTTSAEKPVIASVAKQSRLSSI
ncbi:hypothetical protein C8D86_11354 [Aquicella lusitana]|uniref:Uncharacterized protein n=1 Tax=Aquicella lusitana TaxID=254246 RepID=A0A370GK02_9COXI|nr:hypothetical protein C8D86_11354 [Aquicella lusitana]